MSKDKKNTEPWWKVPWWTWLLISPLLLFPFILFDEDEIVKGSLIYFTIIGGVVFISEYLPDIVRKNRKAFQERVRSKKTNEGDALMQKPFLIVAAVMLLVAIFPWNYSFYPVLRIVVTISAAYAAYYFFERDDSQSGIILTLIAILFNPIAPIYLDKGIWIPIDIGVAIYMYILSKKIV
jgi:hypothetical protein